MSIQFRDDQYKHARYIWYGIDATTVIKSKFPAVKAIILTMHDVDCIAEAALKSGAFWCLNKGCSPKEIYKAIRTAVI